MVKMRSRSNWQRRFWVISSTFMVIAPAWSQTAALPAFTAAGVLNAANYAAGPVVPGEIVDIFGSALGPAALANLHLTSGGLVSNSLGGTQVLFDGIPAPLIFVQQQQIAAIVPYGIVGKTTTQLKVTTAAGASAPVAMTVGNTAPGLFTFDASGTGLAAALNQDGVTVNTPQTPAPAGSIVVLFGTGEGPTIPSGVDGKIASAPPLPSPAFPISVTIGGLPANVLYAGAAPSLVAGVLQIDVQIPYGANPGNSVPVVVSAGLTNSPAGTTLAVSAATPATLGLVGLKFEPNLSDTFILQATKPNAAG